MNAYNFIKSGGEHHRKRITDSPPDLRLFGIAVASL